MTEKGAQLDFGGSLLLVGGREFAELRNSGWNNAQSEIDIGLRGVAAEAEAKAGARIFGRQTNGCEDVRRLDGTG